MQEKKIQRDLASVNKEEGQAGAENTLTLAGPSDMLTNSFRKAVHTMSVVGDPESLSQGLTMITVKGIKSPRDLQRIKESFTSLSSSGLDSFVERSLMKGEVIFLARSRESTDVLKILIEKGTPLKNGIVNEEGSLVFNYGSIYN